MSGTDLATLCTAFLAPCLPYLLETGKQLATDALDSALGPGALHKARKPWSIRGSAGCAGA